MRRGDSRGEAGEEKWLRKIQRAVEEVEESAWQ